MQLPLAIAFTSITLAAPTDQILATEIATQSDFVQEPGSARVTPRLFPFLNWLCDETVELLFGQPRKKTNIAVLPRDLSTRHVDEVVLRLNVSTSQEAEAVAEAATRLLLDVWSFNKNNVDIRLQKHVVSSFVALLPPSLSDSYSTLIPDLDAAIRNASASSPLDRSLDKMVAGTQSLLTPEAGAENVFFRDYRPLSVIVPWLRYLTAMFPSITQLSSIGLSYEGRDIHALRVGARLGDTTPRRRTLVVTGGMHAREWISTTTVNYVAWSFVTGYGRDPMITKLLDHFDFVFIPVVNPDGAEYTWQVDRLWRKSRQQTDLRFCRGFDLDHAFGFGWGSTDGGSDPCSETYGGNAPWEAVEAAVLANWALDQARSNKAQFIGLIDLHSYSQQIMFPYSYTCDVDPPNLENLEELAVGLAKAIRLYSGESYSVSPACEETVISVPRQNHPPRIGASGGSAIDWFYHELRAHFSYQIKLRDTGSYGFLLPRENIIPTGEEMYNAMKYLGDYLLGNNGIEGVQDRANIRTGQSQPVPPSEQKSTRFI
ncbi:ECM14 protein [Sodiomyces alkalinus F11]|uniref:Inactive metallocarboxypeptidase ECM14 n=1 Tax=Sodiomyces alkalinus (strain CBS 110278 / VKM F-3762 / F11) TaxID=1314773 RepID=A0A3N2Q042_SODAK|nr:ECM14 protein [Sodiomyces alkalinus F11]ROT40134.1 ECM14 protein [Sodiomyces alkalinus F11]